MKRLATEERTAPAPTRRELLTGFLGAAIASRLEAIAGESRATPHTPGQPLPFLDEGSEWRALLGAFDGDPGAPRRYGSGLGGRLLCDLAALDPRRKAEASDRFFVRTFRPDRWQERVQGDLAIGGLVRRPRTVRFDELRRRASPRGLHLLECSGNAREHDFGLIGTAAWDGVPALALLESAGPARSAAAVEIEGFDEHRMPSVGSVEGASWIFTPGQLERSGAFFATGMNGEPLEPDHGAPLRLVVPGWYGCVAIKWVTAARWVAADAAATSQMREFAARTHQTGAPDRALDYLPAEIDPAAMPVRAELRRTPRGPELSLTGILWGGPARVRRLELRCGETAPWEPVAVEPALRRGTTPWRFWTHVARPRERGRLAIRLRVADRGVRTRRLDSGYYVRAVEIPGA